MNTTITNRYSVSLRPPIIGQRVRIYDIDVHSDYEGHEATVASTSMDSSMYYAEVKSIQKPDDTLQVRFASYEEVAPTPEPEPDVDALKLAVSALTTEKEQLERDLDSARTQLHAYAADADTIGTMLMDEAENRGWCDEYDEFVDSINTRLTTIHLPEREQEYEVEVSGTATIGWSHTVTVTARSAEDAVQRVEDDPYSFFNADEEAMNAVNYGYGWDSNDIDDVRSN